MKNLELSSAAITITGTCTLACKTCYSNSGPSVKDRFTLEELLIMLTHLAQYGVRHVFLGGGEPLLHPELPAVIGFARHKGLKVAVSTNGHLLAADKLESLFEAGLTHDLSVSIDGPSIEINDSLRGEGAFVRSLRGMYVLNQFGKIVWGVNQVVCKKNLGHSIETAKLAQRMGASYFNLIRFTPFGRGKIFRNQLSITREEFDGEVANLGQLFAPIGNFYDDVLLYDLVGSLSERAVSYFDDRKFNKLPIGISIERDGVVYLTPARIYLGNCKHEPLSTVLEELQNVNVLRNYQEWLRNEWVGVHQPVCS